MHPVPFPQFPSLGVQSQRWQKLKWNLWDSNFLFRRYLLRPVEGDPVLLIKSSFSGFLGTPGTSISPPPPSRTHFSGSELQMRIKSPVLLTWLLPTGLWALCRQNRTLSHNLEEDPDLQPAPEAKNLKWLWFLLPPPGRCFLPPSTSTEYPWARKVVREVSD